MATRIIIRWKPEELFYKLFCEKVCPICLKKLKHQWKKQHIGLTHGFGVTGVKDTIQYHDIYKCENCNQEYSIGELAKEKKRKKREA